MVVQTVHLSTTSFMDYQMMDIGRNGTVLRWLVRNPSRVLSHSMRLLVLLSLKLLALRSAIPSIRDMLFFAISLV
jgi:hypothetical protein